MRGIIVTTGQPFTDIDALACALAYTELLKSEGKNAEAVLPGPLNKTVTQKVKNWSLVFSTKPPSIKAKYVLVDISEPEYFAYFVKEKDIIEIFDHRHGFEDHWNKKLGKNSHIEMVGACATLIWEEFKSKRSEKNISTTCANLLQTAITSNTLNFKASVTTERDKKAYKELSIFSQLPNDWVEAYFKDQDNETNSNISSALINDTKNIDPIIGQLELWDSKKIILSHLKEIEQALLSFGQPNWFLTSPSISEGVNYIYTKSTKMKKLLEKAINVEFRGDIGTTKKLWLRKEILRRI